MELTIYCEHFSLSLNICLQNHCKWLLNAPLHQGSAKFGDNLDEMDKFLERHKLPKLAQEETEDLNKLITSKDIKLVMKNFFKRQLTTKKSTGPVDITG